MQILSAIAQLRTTDLAESIRFYTSKVGLTLEFQLFHLKLVDEKDPPLRLLTKMNTFTSTLKPTMPSQRQRLSRKMVFT